MRGAFIPSLRATRVALRHVLPLAIAAMLSSLPTAAQESETAEQNSKKNAASTMLDHMRQRAQSLVLTKTDDAAHSSVPLQTEPLLHYTDPGGITTDATIWAWGKTARPLALAAIFYEKKASGIDKWSCELTALADCVQVESQAGWQWTPAKSDIDLKPAPADARPGDTPRQRARQMNEIARRFSVAEKFSAQRTDQLRLMPRALYRYADPDQGLLDGALYAFASGTNPEALLLVEARTTPDGAAWHYGFARLGAAGLLATLDDELVWQRPGIVRWSANEPYYSVFGADDAVFSASPDGK